MEGKTPKDAAKLRVLDPACGSGSFLIGAFQFLLDWHRDWYVANGGVAKHTKELYEGPGGAWQLKAATRKSILRNSIYGVDIDAQAVEVTKLSLLLKVLEGESAETLNSNLKLFKERALPDLGDNIKCGNSLIGPDFYALPQAAALGTDELLRINPFDWSAEFKAIMQGGGFDAVIGNPPYIRIQAMKEWAPFEVEFYKKAYVSASKGNYDIYVVFMEKGLGLLNKNGRLGYILPHKFFNSQYGQPIRKLISDGKHLSDVVHFGDQQIFANATTYTTLLFLVKTACDQVQIAKVDNLVNWRTDSSAIQGIISSSSLSDIEWNLVVGVGAELSEKLKVSHKHFGEIADIFVGLQTSADDVFIMDFVSESNGSITLKSVSLGQNWEFEKGIAFPVISGADVRRYTALPKRQFILFPYHVEPNVSLIEMKTLAQKFPKTADYLKANKARLSSRENGKLVDAGWHGYIYLKNMKRQNHVKLTVPRLVNRLFVAFDEQGNHFLDNVDVGGITLKAEFTQTDLKYIMGTINSRLMTWYFPTVSAPFRGGYMSANKQYLAQLPIRTINFDDPADKARHDKMVALVETMLKLHKDLPGKIGQEKTVMERQIAATDGQIDKLVYELYGLTEAEVKIVEGVG